MLKWSWIWSINWQNCKIYPSLCFKFMIRSLNVPIVHLSAQWNLNLFLVDILRYQITIDAQLKFPPVSYKELLKYYFLKIYSLWYDFILVLFYTHLCWQQYWQVTWSGIYKKFEIYCDLVQTTKFWVWFFFSYTYLYSSLSQKIPLNSQDLLWS